MGKLMILKLRDDYKAKMGDAYALKDFHDAFIKARTASAATDPQGDAWRDRQSVLAATGLN